ncbi:phage tail protein [Clostridium botulinum]|uniref:phage tail-collar fiber domain-containing protein n=1 Tax=Clostridium botulinum TaxID=1491 RepID=UPI001E5098E1|nr:phage tail protein [Clostridium botulinum]
MIEQFYTILTSIGKAKIANANVLGNKVKLATLAVGNSNGKYYNPDESQDKLVNEVWKGKIQSVSIDKDNPNWIITESIIPSSVGGFMVREVGLFDEEGDLLVVGKYPETYKPVIANGAAKDLRIRLILEVSNASNVTLKINPAVIFATKEDIENIEKQIGNIKVPVESVNGKTGEIELTAEDIKTKKGINLEDLSKQHEDYSEQLKNLQTKKADQSFVDSQIATIVSGAPKGTYPTLTALKEAYPGGAEGIFLVLENGHWYYWNKEKTEWLDGGVYQATSIKNNGVTVEKCDFVTIDRSDNLLDLNKVTRGYFLSDGGKMIDNSDYFTSNFIKVSLNDIIRYSYDAHMGTNNKVYCYDKDKKLLSVSNGELNADSIHRVANLTDANVKYIRISFNNENFNTAMITANKEYPKNYKKYYNKNYLNTEFYLNDTQKNEVENIMKINCLTDKIVAWNGDSICAGDGWRGGYPKIISERNNMISENIAIGGGSITAEQYHVDNHKPRHWISRTIEKMRSDADYAILEGGVNDYSLKVPFGIITKDFTSKLDDTTFCGAFESMLKQLILKFQGKKIGYILVHRIWDNNLDFNSKWYPAILEMCAKWGVPVCDLYKNCPSLKLNEQLKNKYTNNKDGWHPNEEGYRKYYVDKIESWMKTL